MRIFPTVLFSPLFANNAVIRLMHNCDGGYSYNHTLAHILVEYASAVSFPPSQRAGKLFSSQHLRYRSAQNSDRPFLARQFLCLECLFHTISFIRKGSPCHSLCFSVHHFQPPIVMLLLVTASLNGSLLWHVFPEYFFLSIYRLNLHKMHFRCIHLI